MSMHARPSGVPGFTLQNTGITAAFTLLLGVLPLRLYMGTLRLTLGFLLLLMLLIIRTYSHGLMNAS
jgi:hypothetical protein